jgi:hypothetical protein
LPLGRRSLDEVIQLVGMAYLWASASLPADPFAATRRLAVLHSITGHLSDVICGSRWGQAEQRAAVQRDSRIVASELVAAIGIQPYQLALASDLQRRASSLTSLAPSQMTNAFAAALALHGRAAGVRDHEGQLAEFLLRLATQPSSLGAWAPVDLRSKLELTLASPVLLRAARLLVRLVAADGRGDTNTSNGEGWAWE